MAQNRITRASLGKPWEPLLKISISTYLLCKKISLSVTLAAREIPQAGLLGDILFLIYKLFYFEMGQMELRYHSFVQTARSLHHFQEFLIPLYVTFSIYIQHSRIFIKLKCPNDTFCFPKLKLLPKPETIFFQIKLL